MACRFTDLPGDLDAGNVVHSLPANFVLPWCPIAYITRRRGKDQMGNAMMPIKNRLKNGLDRCDMFQSHRRKSSVSKREMCELARLFDGLTGGAQRICNIMT